MRSEKEIDIKINKKEVYRYLGYKNSSPDASVAEKIDEYINQIIQASELRSLYEKFPVKFTDNPGRFYIGNIEIKSMNLAKNLKDCHSAYLLGASIGIGTDRLITRAGISDAFAAAVYQAAGAAYVEDYCDYINDEIRRNEENLGNKLRPRFSPGYGDFSLDYQKEIFRLLNLPKHVGISLTDSLIMSPSKSVTAIIGVSKKDGCLHEDSALHKCENCEFTDCQYRLM